MANYHYTECGLKNVYLANGYSVHKTKHGEGVSVKDVGGLHKAIGEFLLEKPKLAGDEIRFLRKELGLSQKDMGELVGTSDQTIANWEKGKTEVNRAADLCLRAHYRETVLNENAAMRNLIQTVVNADQQVREISAPVFCEHDRWELMENVA